MKAIITLSIVLLFGVIAQAQSKDLQNANPKSMENANAISPTTSSMVVAPKVETLDCAFLSKFKNNRVKKALLFTAGITKTKMA